MRITTALFLFREVRYLCRVLKKYSDSLAAGKYSLFGNYRSMSINDVAVFNESRKYLELKPAPKRWEKIAKILNKVGLFYNNNKATTGEYEAFYTANTYEKVREIKLFSFKRKQILTICKSVEDMKSQLSEYESLKPFYKLPHMQKCDRYEASLSVALIERLPAPSDDMALSAIALSTTSYNANPSSLTYIQIGELIGCSYQNEQYNLLLGDLSSRIDAELLKTMLPVCRQHGDLSKDNLLYGEINGEKAFWWIDWEHMGDRVFFYDYFFYILNSALYDDMMPYYCYIGNQCDDSLRAFFAHFNIVYDPSRKFDYFLVFAICFLKERVCDLGYSAALEKYYDIITNRCADAFYGGATA